MLRCGYECVVYCFYHSSWRDSSTGELIELATIFPDRPHGK